MNHYELLQPPIKLEFSLFSARQASDYFEWFIGIIPLRMSILYTSVHEVYSGWLGDYSVSSLDILGEWFSKSLETKSRSEKEIEQIYEDAPAWFRDVPVSGKELTTPSLAMAFDVGIYLGEMCRRNLGATWCVSSAKKKSNADYGQAVISHKSTMQFNAVRLSVVQAYGLVNQTRRPAELREIYEVWSKILMNN